MCVSSILCLVCDLNSPFHEISACWRCLEFQPITDALTLQCGSVCCYVRQAAGGLKENALKTCYWKRNGGCSLCVYTGKSDSRYRPKSSDSGKNSENVKNSEGHRALLVLLTMQKKQVLAFFAVKRENFRNRHRFIVNIYMMNKQIFNMFLEINSTGKGLV